MQNAYELGFFGKLRSSVGMIIFFAAVVFIFICTSAVYLLVPTLHETIMWRFFVMTFLTFIVPFAYAIFLGVYVRVTKKNYQVVYVTTANAVSLFGVALWLVVGMAATGAGYVEVWASVGVKSVMDVFVMICAPVILEWIMTFMFWRIPDVDKSQLKRNVAEDTIIGIATYGMGRRKDDR